MNYIHGRYGAIRTGPESVRKLILIHEKKSDFTRKAICFGHPRYHRPLSFNHAINARRGTGVTVSVIHRSMNKLGKYLSGFPQHVEIIPGFSVICSAKTLIFCFLARFSVMVQQLIKVITDKLTFSKN